MQCFISCARVALVLAVAILAGCGVRSESSAIVVFAASSLTDAFGEIARAYEAENPGTAVRLNVAGSQVLRLQLEQGAVADVMATAHREHVDALREAGVVDAATEFAANRLAIVVPRDNPAAITGVADLTRATSLVVAGDYVPLGRYTHKLLQNLGGRFDAAFADAVRARIASEENNARLVRAKVVLGEADAAILYRTDAVGVDELSLIEIPEPENVVVQYLAAPVSGRPNNHGARFVGFLATDRAQTILARYGFQAS